MHLINDENGNVVPHGHDHEHTHDHGHSHGCNSCGDSGCQGNCTEEVVALLNYMLSHNEHHAEELDQIQAMNMTVQDAVHELLPVGKSVHRRYEEYLPGPGTGPAVGIALPVSHGAIIGLRYGVPFLPSAE